MILSLVFSALLLGAQEQDSLFLREVQITASKLVVDTSLQNTMMGSFSPAVQLSSVAPVYLRMNSPGGLTTLSFRGQAPHQLPIFWNGVNLQNTMNGLYDLALLPMGIYRSQFEETGTSNLLPLDNLRGLSVSSYSSVATPGLSILYRIGSYGLHQGLLKARFNLGKGHLQVYWSEDFARNNFTFPDITQAGSPKTALQNAKTFIRHRAADYFKNTSRDTISIHLLYTQADRQIPPSVTEINHGQSQQDTSLKLSATYKRNTPAGLFTFTPAWIYDINRYLTNRHITSLVSGQLQYHFKLLNFGESGISYLFQNQGAWSAVFGPNGIQRSRNELQLFHDQQLSEAWKLRLTVQANMLDSDFLPPGLILSSTYNKTAYQFTFQAGRTVKPPTLNDLYWPGSGNPDLKPESTLFVTGSLGSTIWQNELNKFSVKLTPEYKIIDNYILWIPTGGFFWRPENVKKVSTLSTDLEVKMQSTIYGIQTEIGGVFQWLRARTFAVYNSNQVHSVNKQLIYTPTHMSRAFLKMHFRGSWEFNGDFTWMSERFTSRDNSSALPALFLLNAGLSKGFGFHGLNCRFAVSIENIGNVNYQMIAFRPMPGRTFNTSILITI